MNKILVLMMLLVLMLGLISCTMGKEDRVVLANNYEETADNTFNEIISAIMLSDKSKIVNMFACSVRSDSMLSQSAAELFDYIRGDIVSFSAAAEAGVGMNAKIEHGKKQKEIQSSFLIKTTEDTYYIAIKERILDELNHDVGILSIYIIKSENWVEDYVYRGDGKWTHGINIVDALVPAGEESQKTGDGLREPY